MVASVNLQRFAFETSRLIEFCSKKELVAQTGHQVYEWPCAILKELVDNALDAAEEAEIAPEINIKVSTETSEIVITDNGPGLPPATVDGILNFNVRVSSREAYVSPTRGAQGNALKTICAMPFALDGNRGVTVIEAHGVMSTITFEMDPLRREPRPTIERELSVVQNGTRITVRWPELACWILKNAKNDFVQMARDSSVLNPHLSIFVDWDDEAVVAANATNPTWRKWRACDPTSAHWYDVERFERYMAAHIVRDEDRGTPGRTVRDFITELRGLTRSAKQKAVLADVDASGVPLADFFSRARDAIAGLLEACRSQTKPVPPDQLGLLGKDHLQAVCMAAGVAEESYCYRKNLGYIDDSLPYVIEVAFGYCPAEAYRQLTTGVNFSVGIDNPFRQISAGYGELGCCRGLCWNLIVRSPVG
jgi:DNA topoisomerase VI subunit B